MSGHSKWANIKHQKGKADAQRGKIFTKIGKEIVIAVQMGGADPTGNMKLKLALQKARENNVPKDNIERSIKKGLGAADASNYEEILYEGYGPGGVAVLLDIMTDNRNRTAGEIRHLFSKYGGNLGEAGCVAWMFEKKGLFVIERDHGVQEDELMELALEAGAEDFSSAEDSFEIITQPEDFDTVQLALQNKGIQAVMERITMLAKTDIALEGDDAQKMMKLLDVLEEHDDVQEVYTNADMNIPDQE